jgi:hypothetical protein
MPAACMLLFDFSLKVVRSEWEKINSELAKRIPSTYSGCLVILMCCGDNVRGDAHELDFILNSDSAKNFVASLLNHFTNLTPSTLYVLPIDYGKNASKHVVYHLQDRKYNKTMVLDRKGGAQLPPSIPQTIYAHLLDMCTEANRLYRVQPMQASGSASATSSTRAPLINTNDFPSQLNPIQWFQTLILYIDDAVGTYLDNVPANERMSELLAWEVFLKTFLERVQEYETKHVYFNLVQYMRTKNKDLNQALKGYNNDEMTSVILIDAIIKYNKDTPTNSIQIETIYALVEESITFHQQHHFTLFQQALTRLQTHFSDVYKDKTVARAIERAPNMQATLVALFEKLFLYVFYEKMCFKHLHIHVHPRNGPDRQTYTLKELEKEISEDPRREQEGAALPPLAP